MLVVFQITDLVVESFLFFKLIWSYFDYPLNNHHKFSHCVRIYHYLSSNQNDFRNCFAINLFPHISPNIGMELFTYNIFREGKVISKISNEGYQWRVLNLNFQCNIIRPVILEIAGVRSSRAPWTESLFSRGVRFSK